MKLPAVMHLNAPTTIITNRFSFVTNDRSITFDSEIKYYIEKWDLDEKVYRKEVSKEEYESCGYPNHELATNSDIYSRIFEEFTIIKFSNLTIKVRYPDILEHQMGLSEDIVEDIFDNKEHCDAHPDTCVVNEIDLMDYFSDSEIMIIE